MTQIGSDWVENLTRQRHDRDQTENQQNALPFQVQSTALPARLS